MFNENSTISEIISQPVFKDIAKYILPEWEIDAVTFAGMKRFWESPDFRLGRISEIFPEWNMQALIEGINYLYDRFTGGQANCFKIWNDGQIKEDPALADVVLFYFPVIPGAHSIIICPGGGYDAVCSIAEGFPIAKSLNAAGFNVFVLNYRTYPHAEYLNPQADLARAVAFINENAPALQVDPASYSVCGFSAGGHLAASWGTANMGYTEFKLPAPTALILAYPVISMTSKTHAGSRHALLGEIANEEKVNFTSVEKQVTDSYPPTFIWHCLRDGSVDFDVNSKAMAESLERNKIRYEFLPVDSNLHGIGAGIGTPAEGWLQKAIEFIKSVESV
jgi:acetyl esterase/lipase